MTPNNAGSYEGMLRRVKRMIIVLGIVGAIAVTVWKDVRFGGGFLVGAMASYVSFWRYQKVVEALGTKTSRRSPWMLAIRLIVLLAVVYVIIKFSGVNLAAAFFGLLVPAAAVIIEILYELIYAGT